MRYQKELISTNSFGSQWINNRIKGSEQLTVHSIFTSSLNLINQDLELISIQTNQDLLSGFGFTVDQALLEQLIKTIVVNDLVILDKSIFRFNNLTLKIHLNKTYQSKPQTQLDQNSALVQSLLSVNLDKTGFVEPYFDINKLMNLNDFESLLNYCIGRGIGLTPSGDDFIMGYLMIKYLLDDYQKEFELLKASTLNTNQISLMMINQLLNENWAWIYIQLLENQYNKQKVDQLIQTLKHYGHTSGQDTLFGMKMALQKSWN